VATNAKRRAGRSDVDRERDRERYRRNPEARKQQNKRRRQADPERAKARDAERYRRTAERRKRQAREWAERNKERRAEAIRNWHREQRRTSSRYRLKQSVSSYLYWCLKNAKAGVRTEDILGYSIEDLKQHLERQFAPGMSSDNYGEWHVDHIVPVASFDFTGPDDEEFKACWAITNLRPLWAVDNVRKSDKRTHLI
jgi:hypothetical protein